MAMDVARCVVVVVSDCVNYMRFWRASIGMRGSITEHCLFDIYEPNLEPDTASSFTRHGFEPQTQIVRIGTPDLLGTTVDPA